MEPRGNSAVLFAFVDESGNHDLRVENEGATALYVCVAVIVDERQRTAAIEGMTKVATNHAGGSEIKSSRIGSNHDRRLRILQAVSSIDFGYYAMVVDKTRIDQDSGLRFKPSFFKFLAQMLYRKLCMGGVEKLEVVADEYGGQAFMASLEPYLQSKGFPNLFTEFSHQFVNSSENRLVQLADLIAGSLSYVYDPEKAGDHSGRILEFLRPKQIGISSWPPLREASEEGASDDSQAWENEIRTSSLNTVEAFEQKHDDSADEDRQMQIAVLRHLLFVRQYGEDGPGASAFADSLIRHLGGLGFPELTRQSFSSRVIGPLRDAGIILAGSNDGYRIAMDKRDIDLYLDHDKAIICPMLFRLKKAREVLRQNTANRVDILSVPDYSILRLLVEAFEDDALGNLGVAMETDPDD